MKFHNFDPKHSLIMVEPRPGESLLRTEDIVALIHEHDFALVLLPGVQYASGQVLDMPTIAKAAHDRVRLPIRKAVAPNSLCTGQLCWF